MNTLPAQSATTQPVRSASPTPPKSINTERFINDLRAFIESEELVKALKGMVEQNILSMSEMQSPMSILNAEPGSFGASSGFGASSSLANTQSSTKVDNKATDTAEKPTKSLDKTTVADKKPQTSRWFKMPEMDTHILSESSMLNSTATQDLFTLDKPSDQKSKISEAGSAMPSLMGGESTILTTAEDDKPSIPSMGKIGESSSVLNVSLPSLNTSTSLLSVSDSPSLEGMTAVEQTQGGAASSGIPVPQMMGASTASNTEKPSQVASSSITVPQMMGASTATNTETPSQVASSSITVPQMMGASTATNTEIPSQVASSSIPVPQMMGASTATNTETPSQVASSSIPVPQMMGASTATNTEKPSQAASSSITVPQMMGASATTNLGASSNSIFSTTVPSFSLVDDLTGTGSTVKTSTPEVVEASTTSVSQPSLTKSILDVPLPSFGLDSTLTKSSDKEPAKEASIIPSLASSEKLDQLTKNGFSLSKLSDSLKIKSVSLGLDGMRESGSKSGFGNHWR